MKEWAHIADMPADLVANISKITQELPGWNDLRRQLILARHVLDTSPSLVLEIGVFAGRSLISQALALKENSPEPFRHGVAYGIDPWDNELAKDDPDLKDYDMGKMYDLCFNAILELGLRRYAVMIQAKAKEVYDIIADDSLDILHIDGSHKEEDALEDALLYLPKVKVDGWIWFDDTHFPSTQKALMYLKERCELVSMEPSFWLFQKLAV